MCKVRKKQVYRPAAMDSAVDSVESSVQVTITSHLTSCIISQILQNIFLISEEKHLNDLQINGSTLILFIIHSERINGISISTRITQCHLTVFLPPASSIFLHHQVRPDVGQEQDLLLKGHHNVWLEVGQGHVLRVAICGLFSSSVAGKNWWR